MYKVNLIYFYLFMSCNVVGQELTRIHHTSTVNLWTTKNQKHKMSTKLNSFKY